MEYPGFFTLLRRAKPPAVFSTEHESGQRLCRWAGWWGAVSWLEPFSNSRGRCSAWCHNWAQRSRSHCGLGYPPPCPEFVPRCGGCRCSAKWSPPHGPLALRTGGCLLLSIPRGKFCLGKNPVDLESGLFEMRTQSLKRHKPLCVRGLWERGAGDETRTRDTSQPSESPANPHK